MNHNAGIWIDFKKAVIVSALPERITAMTLESDAGQPPPDGLPDDRYYDEILSQLGQPDALLIFGPDEAKLQLRERLGRSQTLSACLVGVETTDTLTDPQIVAKVRQHYGIAPPGAGINRSRMQ
jgi:hypothetical protein